MKRNSVIIIAAGAIAVLVFVLVWLLATDSGTGDLSREDAIDRSNRDPTEGYQFGQEGAVDFTQAAVSYEQVLEDYERWSQYPPDSRPLRPEYRDQIEHHWIPLPKQKMPVPDGDGGLKDPTFACRLQPLNHSVTEGQKMEVTLRCSSVAAEQASPGGGPGVPLDVREVKLERFVGDRTFGLPTPEILPGTADNDYTYTFVYNPAANDWGDVQIEANFVIPEEKSNFTHTLKSHFFSSPTAPARFTRVVGERIDDGSLVIVVELNVRFPGRYTIEANLFNEEGPVAHARKDARFSGGGPQRVELEFFGKVMHDQNAPGPYFVRGLRGIQDTDPVDPLELTKSVEEVEKYLAQVKSDAPHRRVIPTFEEEYRTKPYDLSELSNAEWDSPTKRERLSELRELAGQ